MVFDIIRPSHVEDDHMSVEVRRRVSVYRTGAVMLELCGDHSAGCLGRLVSSKSRLNVTLELVESNADTLLVSLSDTCISSNQGGNRHALRCIECGVPGRTVSDAPLRLAPVFDQL